METIENLPTLISNVLNFVANAAKNLDFVRVRIKIPRAVNAASQSEQQVCFQVTRKIPISEHRI